MANKYSEEDKELFEQYEEETGKQAVWKGKLTKGFKDWKSQPIEIPEYDETEDMEEAIEEVIEEEEVEEVEEVDTTQIEAQLQGLKDFRKQVENYMKATKVYEKETAKLPKDLPDGLSTKIAETQLSKLHTYSLRVVDTSQRKLFNQIDKVIKRLEAELEKA